MQRIIKIVINAPKLALLGLLIISIAAILQLSKLRIDASVTGFMPAKSEAKAFYQLAQENFGTENALLAFVEDRDLFTPQKLNLLRDIAGQLGSIEGVARVDSLFSLKRFIKGEDTLSGQRLFETIPNSSFELEQLRRAALNHPIARTLLSSDATAMLLIVHLRNTVAQAELDAQVITEAEKIIAPLSSQAVTFSSNSGSFERAFQVGDPVFRLAFAEAISADLDIIILLSFLVVLVFLVIRLRYISMLILPFLIAGLNILWTFGLMAALDLPINLLTAIVPVLIIVLGTLQTGHLMHAYLRARREGESKPNALLYMASRLRLTFFVTFTTLLLALICIGLNEIYMMRQFAIAASCAWLLNLVISLVVVPLYLLAFSSPHKPDEMVRSLSNRASSGLMMVMPQKKTRFLAVFTVLLMVQGSGIIWLQLNNNPRVFFPDDALIHTRNTVISERLHGTQKFNIVFTAAQAGSFQEPQLLAEIEKVQDFIRQMNLFDISVSIVDLLSLINQIANDGSSQYYRLPPTQEQVQLYVDEALSRNDLRPFVSADFRQANLSVWHDLHTSHEFNTALARLQEFTNTLDKRLTVRYTGADVLINSATDLLLDGQFKAVLLLCVLLYALISILFMSFKAGIIALLPNLVTLLMLYGLMGYLEIPLDVGTALIAIIILAVAMNFTLGFMIRYNEEVLATDDDEQALARALSSAVAPMVMASIVIIVGFGVLLAANLKPIAYFGGLSAAMLLLVLLVNLLLMPRLLMSMRFVPLWGMMRIDVDRKVIEDCELFRGMHPWQIKQIILMSRVETVPAGELFIRQGDLGHEMFVILEGTSRVEKIDSEGNTQVLAKFDEGNVIGEVALVSQQQRTANLIAETELKLLVLEWQTLELLARFLPMISSRLFLNIAEIIGKRFGNQ